MTDDLIGGQPEAKPRRMRKPKAEPAVSVRLEREFKVQFQTRYGFPPIVCEGRDRKLLNTLVEQWGEEAVFELMRDFFLATRPGATGYQEIRRLRWHNIPDFYTGAQILRRLHGDRTADLSDRTAANVSEIARAMGRDKRR